MFVKLKSGMSYTYGKFVATKDKPVIEVPDNVGNYLISTGRFLPTDGAEDVKNEVSSTITTADFTKETGTSTSEIPEVPDVSKMTVEEINALASELGVEFPAAAKKTEKIKILTSFLNKKDE